MEKVQLDKFGRSSIVEVNSHEQFLHNVQKIGGIIILGLLTIFMVAALPSLLAIQKNQLETVATAQTTNGVPPAYVGVWKGHGFQDNNTEWSILMTLISGTVDSIVGTIGYPTLTCGGELTLQRVNANSIELYEYITYGNSRCVDNGINTLKLVSNKKLEYRWQHSTRSNHSTATGTVRRISD